MFKLNVLTLCIMTASLTLAGCNGESPSQVHEKENAQINMGINPPVFFEGMDLTRYVNPFIGTGNLGNTYPGATTPHGMVQLSPNNGSNGWEYISGYYYHDARMAGFSHTHLSGAGAGDLNDILVMPINTKSNYMIGKGSPTLHAEASRFQHRNESATAGYYSVFLDDYGIKAELTASDRVGVHRYHFPKDSKSEVIINLGFKLNWDFTAESRFEWDEKTNTLKGHRFSDGWAPSQKEFFISEFNQPIKKVRFEYYDKNQKTYVPIKESPSVIEGGLPFVQEQYVRAYVEFDTSKAPLTVEVKLGLSNTEIGSNGETGASLNMTEVAGKNFDAVRREATQKWEEELSKLRVEGDVDYKQTFYSALYHSLLGQTLHSDLDGRYRQVNQGRAAYPDGIDSAGNQIDTLKDPVRLADINKDGVADYTRYDTFSLWDTYRSVQPLSSLIEEERLVDVVLSMLSYAEETWVDDNGVQKTGRLPEWTFKGNETGMMMGMHSTPVIYDVLNKGSLERILTKRHLSSTDIQDVKERLVRAMIKDAKAGSAVESITEYERDGYKPARLHPTPPEDPYGAHSPFESAWTASFSLEYSFNDWNIAQSIKLVLGETAPEYIEFADRSKNWMSQFDVGGAKYKGWFKARDFEGKFIDSNWIDPQNGGTVKDWRPELFNYAFAESNGWQYSFSVQHDIHGLIDVMTGFDQINNPQAKQGDLFAARLDEYWSTYPDRNAGDNQFPVFNTGNVGQHVQGNEPDHHVPYLYNYVGQAWKTQSAVAASTNICYDNTPNGICGNDDFGTMSSWFVFRALGFYPVNAASGIFEIGTPLFKNARMKVGNGKTFEISAINVDRQNIFIQSARLNGQDFNRTYLTYDEIMAGGALEFTMGALPNKAWGSAPESAPPSLGVGTFSHNDKMPIPYPTVNSVQY